MFYHHIDCTSEAATEAMAKGPEDLWRTLRRQKYDPRNAYYAVVDQYNRDAIYKGLTYPDVRHG